MTRPVLLAASTVMAHVPGLVRIGSKPAREVARDPGLVERLVASARGFDDAVGYAPNQAFIGAIHPRAMGPRPHFNRVVEGGRPFGPHGDVIPDPRVLAL